MTHLRTWHSLARGDFGSNSSDTGGNSNTALSSPAPSVATTSRTTPPPTGNPFYSRAYGGAAGILAPNSPSNTGNTPTHTTSNSANTMAGGTAASQRYQHQQQLMQKLHGGGSGAHYGGPGSSGPPGSGGPGGPGPPVPPHHHHTFSYPGPPASPAGYPGYPSHPGPPQHAHSGHSGHGGPPGNHLQGGPSPGLHHPGSGLTPGGGPPGQGGPGQSPYSSSHHLGGGNTPGSGQQMNGHHAHQHGVNGTSGGNNQQGGQNQQNQQQTNWSSSSSTHAQQQVQFASVSRQSTSAHHHARAAHLQQRGMTTSNNVPIGDPSRHPSMSIGRSAKDSSASNGDESRAVTSIRKAGLHDSSPTQMNTAARIEAEREKTGQAWSTIDMGGMHLRNLSAELFRYSFLTTLYVPHNNLTSLPAALSTLVHLILLDASGNKLTSVPGELGMLTNLRELLLFDNQLSGLPAELGTLHQLDILGIEGNPLPDNLRNLMEKEGTSGLIAYLRDSCPVPLPPADREWITVEADSFPSVADAGVPEPEVFSVSSYNVLCEKMATSHMYGYTPSWALSWDYRKELILQEIMGYSADILCLQEVDGEQYEDYFLRLLSEHNYEGIHWPRTKARTMSSEERRHVDGCATFYKSATFQLVEQQLIEFNQVAMRRPDFKKTEDMFNRVMTKDNIAVLALLEHRASGARVIVANAHIHWDPEFRDVKLVQAAMLMEELGKVADHFARLPPKRDLGKGYDKAPSYKNGTEIPTIICGDFNSTPDSGVYEFLANGSVERDHEDFMHHIYGNYTSEGLAHRLALKSSYSHLEGSSSGLPITNYTPGFKGHIDYIWYTANSLSVTGLLGEVDPAYLGKVVGFPNAHFPSDHIYMLSEFKIKPQVESDRDSGRNERPHFRPPGQPNR